MESATMVLSGKLSFEKDLPENVIHTITDLLKYAADKRKLIPTHAKTPEHFLFTRLMDLKTALSGERHKKFIVEEVIVLDAANATQKATINTYDQETFSDVTGASYWENNITIAKGELHRRFDDCVDWFSGGLGDVSSKIASAAVDSDSILLSMETIVRACVVNGFFHKKSENAHVCEAIRKLIVVMPQYVLLGQNPYLPGTWVFIKMY